MNLADLKEQMFELIDQELVDPRGVDEILAALPGGREYFEQIKAALDLADLLPVEEPPVGLDAHILASAGGRTTAR